MRSPPEHATGAEARFVAYLRSLAPKDARTAHDDTAGATRAVPVRSEPERRAALAALRRGLGKRPGEAPQVFPYVVPWLPPNAPPLREDTFYLVASLFASHPIDWPGGDGDRSARNFGASLARLARERSSASIERRFVALLSAAYADLPEHLRHAIALLKSDDVPVDWAQLLHHLQQWNHPDRWVQRAWARAFWQQDED